MDAFTAVMICEGEEEATEEEQLAAWQWLIHTGVVWTLQGSFGRMAITLLDEGLCTLNENSHPMPGR
jgi:hypothetical protein